MLDGKGDGISRDIGAAYIRRRTRQVKAMTHAVEVPGKLADPSVAVRPDQSS
jgi:hypothetical protein